MNIRHEDIYDTWTNTHLFVYLRVGIHLQFHVWVRSIVLPCLDSLPRAWIHPSVLGFVTLCLDSSFRAWIHPSMLGFVTPCLDSFFHAWMRYQPGNEPTGASLVTFVWSFTEQNSLARDATNCSYLRVRSSTLEPPYSPPNKKPLKSHWKTLTFVGKPLKSHWKTLQKP